MTRAAWLPWVLAGLAPVVAQSACADLTVLSMPDIRVNSTQEVGAGDFVPTAAEKTYQVEGFCRVSAVATPTADSVIHFEVWIPSAARWNRKLLGTGNGGFAGSINYAAMVSALARGYAAVGSDTGHTGDQMEFGDGHPQKVIDWAYRAVHVTTQAAQNIVRSYIGAAPAHSYFQGCSTGGQQALSEVQRFPEDYDGVVAGAPGNDRIRLILGFLWSWSALHDSQGKPLLNVSQLSRLTREVTEQCDGADGLRDGLVSDSRRCR
ncbi:MAG TPA: tannase/feruloyl esterase family alpha/beta hydrolase, partial [Bryobacteraceae bacterium]